MLPEQIPWKSRAEWIGIYEDAYSNDYSRCVYAVGVMTYWRRLMRGLYRPGMDCTRSLLHIALKDRHIFPDAEQCLEDSELQLMYSAEIMRYLNIAGCSTKESGERRVSLYGKAKELGIEDWVVNIRHRAAHGGSLPPIPVLRRAVQAVLAWLKREYWEVEKEGMKEVVVEEPGKSVSENLRYLLAVYVSLKEQSILGFKRVRDIQDPDVKQLLSSVNGYSLREAKASSKPWDVPRGSSLNVTTERLNNLPTNKAIANVIKLIKDFVDCDEIYGTRPLSIVTDSMIEDSLQHNGMRRDVWNSLLRALHSWYKFPELIRLLCKKSFDVRGEAGYQAGIWCTELCKALYKRYQVHLLSDYLFKRATSGKAVVKKKINLNSSELKELRKLLLKEKRHCFDKRESVLFARLFVRVEENDRSTRDSLRLKDSIFPEHWELMDLIGEIALSPTPFTQQALQSLFPMVKWPLGEERLKGLLALTRIYQGEGIHAKKGCRLYKLSHLQQAIKHSSRQANDDEAMEIE